MLSKQFEEPAHAPDTTPFYFFRLRLFTLTSANLGARLLLSSKSLFLFFQWHTLTHEAASRNVGNWMKECWQDDSCVCQAVKLANILRQMTRGIQNMTAASSFPKLEPILLIYFFNFTDFIHTYVPSQNSHILKNCI